MITKRFLILTPVGIIVFLLQSLYWAPTYDRQSQTNPNRLLQFIQSSIGDAEILNPILSADSASSSINDLIFDGLIDLDDKLNYRPRLAKNWIEYEEAFLALDFDFEFNGIKMNSGNVWKTYILDKLQGNTSWFKNIEKIEILKSEISSGEIAIKPEDKSSSSSKVPYSLTIPYRLKFTLKKVDQDFFKTIFGTIGETYQTDFPYEKFIRFESSF